MVYIYFGIFLLILIFLGIWSGRYGKKNQEDYILGGRSLNKYLVGISAAATGNSGFIMTGAVGLGYTLGLTWVFLPIAWLLGDLIFWKRYPKDLNQISKDLNTYTITGLISTKDNSKSIITIFIASVILLIIIGAYTASQFVAASKTFDVFFSLDLRLGVIFTAVIVGIYSISGGLRASVWTDLLQAFVMFIVTTLMLIVGLLKVGGLNGLYETLNDVDPKLLSIFSEYSVVGIVGFFLGWSSAALGFGLSQPQILTRYFAGKSPEETIKARWIYILFLQYTWIGMTLFGVFARALIDNISDPETALPVYVMTNFSPLIVALVVAGIFSAIASTVDSLVLSLGSIISVDIMPVFIKNKKLLNKRSFHQLISIVVILITVIAALFTESSVFTLSAFAVSLLASTLGAAVLLKLFKKNSSFLSINLAMVSGGIISLLWRNSEFSITTNLNEAFPGLLLGFIIGWIIEKFIK